MATPLLWSDALVLLSTLLADREGPVPLAEVVGHADRVQGSILSFQEMHGAIARLGAAGHLSYADGELTAKEAILTFWRAGPARLPKLAQQAAAVEAHLGTGPHVQGTDPRRADEGVEAIEGFDRERFEAAVEAYLGSLHR